MFPSWIRIRRIHSPEKKVTHTPVELHQLGLEAGADEALHADDPQQLVQRHLLARQVLDGF